MPSRRVGHDLALNNNKYIQMLKYKGNSTHNCHAPGILPVFYTLFYHITLLNSQNNFMGGGGRQGDYYIPHITDDKTEAQCL